MGKIIPPQTFRRAKARAAIGPILEEFIAGAGDVFTPAERAQIKKEMTGVALDWREQKAATRDPEIPSPS